MICCKIITDFKNPNGNFEKLLNELGKHGSVLWENNYLFFGDVDHIDVNYNKVGKILKKYGYTKFFIDEYTKENQPNENESINGWILDKMIKITYKQYEDQSQELFHNIKKGLDMLDQEIADLQKKKQELIEEEENNGRRNNKV